MTNALKKIAELDLPTPKLERWKYTNLPSALKDHPLTPSKANFTLKNGGQFVSQIKESLELPSDRYADMQLWEINNAADPDGYVIDIPKGQILEATVEINRMGQDGQRIMPRLHIKLGENAEATIIERLSGQGTYWVNQVTRIELAQGAKLHHYRVQNDAQSAVNTQNTSISIGRDATYEGFTLTLGAGLSRNQIHASLTGPSGHCGLSGINLLNGKQHGDTTILIEHQAPHCTSNQNYRSLLNENAHGVFQGKVHVHQVAQQTDGYQLSNALLLSETAAMDTKPELEIYADDVKCSHGATTGQLDETPLFYLRSRGIPEAEARRLVLTAFLAEALEDVRDEDVKEELRISCETWLNHV